MQKVSVENLTAGMKTYGRLYTADGRVLLGSNILLNANYIKRLQSLGIYSLSVANPILERIGLVCEATLPEEKKAEAIKNLKEAFNDAKKGKPLNVSRISAMARMIMDSVRMNQIIRLENNVIEEDHIYGHCLNVAALAAVIANDLEYDALRMKELIMGALLHDIGKVLANGDGSEFEHPKNGFEYLRKLRDFSIIAGHVALGHHEKYDGTGYPRSLKGNDIHEYARITAVADVYDNMVSGFLNRQALLPHEAYEAIMSMSSTYLDKEIADAFLVKAPLYPAGAFVVLDNKHIGIVNKVRPRLQARPAITIIADSHGRFLEEWLEMNLAEHLTTFISHIMSEKEAIQLSQQYERVCGKSGK